MGNALKVDDRTEIDEIIQCFSSIDIEPIQPRMGALISGLNLKEDLSDSSKAALLRLLARFKVLFFRDQPMNRSEYVQVAKIFGSPMSTPAPTVSAHPEIIEISSERSNTDTWHSDLRVRFERG